ncbi:hypothetical protein S40293_08705 [Stachybotrys chartarum IBT 40293]|nr:hypothetical protein S40293_08705 [Stachybotrys chartarum IBT 40293]
MAMPRESAFMPAIKCSLCGRDVEISMMGDHLCMGPAEERETSPPPTSQARDLLIKVAPLPIKLDDKFNDRHASPSPPDNGRMPPRVDTGVASRSQSPPTKQQESLTMITDRPYARLDQLTPGSPSSGTQTVSPLTPTGHVGLGQGDGYFSPQIASEETFPSPSQGRRPGGYGGFVDVDPYDASRAMDKQANGNIAAQRFESNVPETLDRYQTATTNRYPPQQDAYGRNLTQSPAPMDQANAGYAAPPKVPSKNGYGGFGPPGKNDPFTDRDNAFRADTYQPSSASTENHARVPSAGNDRVERMKRDSAAEHSRRPSTGPDTTRPPPPRSNTLRAYNERSTSQSSVDLAAEFGIGNPYHTPSDSASSGYSLASNQPSYASAQTSPARSHDSRKPSVVTDMTTAFNDLQMSPQKRYDAVKQSPSRTPPPALDSPYAASPRDMRYERNDPAVQEPRGLNQNLRPDDGLLSSPDSYSPQAKRDTEWFGLQPQEHSRSGSVPKPLTRRLENLPVPTRSDSLPETRRNDRAPVPDRSASVSGPGLRDLTPPIPKASREPPQHPSRGDCKSCGLAIRGKSISSADGRLTGKYHKACFVCASCSEPFTSAEFYVLNDKPYCGQHYHQLNGSLCGGCGRGIEGQYLEDEAMVKYHVGCFRCLDCGNSLSNGYFEVEGGSYCERDAWKRVQASSMNNPVGSDGGPFGQSRGAPSSRFEPPRPPRGYGGIPGGPRGGRQPYGLPGNKPRGGPGPYMGAGMGLAPPRAPQMNKRMTRLGMM